jgi:glucan 1,3-beta-glucosidase
MQGMVFDNCSIGINYTAASSTAATGSLILIDSSAKSVSTLIVAEHNKTADGSIVLENISILNVKTTVSGHKGELILAGSESPKKIESFVQGDLYTNKSSGRYVETSIVIKRNPALVDGTGAYFARNRPQYEDIPSRLFSSVRDFGAIGDGHTDSTDAINKALSANAYRRVTYFPAGVYIVTDTLRVPVGSRIVGEVWSTVMGKFHSRLI